LFVLSISVFGGGVLFGFIIINEGGGRRENETQKKKY